MKAFLREPLVHFLLGGAVILLLFNIFDDSPPPVSEDVLEVTDRDIDRLSARFKATWRRVPTEDELSQLVDQFVRQEILVREALALGLDRGDEIVRQRLVQKITFLAEGSVAALEPTDDELTAHMLEHRDRFEISASAAFRHVLVRDGVDPDDVIAGLQANTDVQALIIPTPLPERFPLTPKAVVDRAFGSGFFDALAVQERALWFGTVESAYGRHAVFVEEYAPASFPELNEVRDAVEADWRALRQSELLEERILALLARYEIVLPDSLTGLFE